MCLRMNHQLVSYLTVKKVKQITGKLDQFSIVLKNKNSKKSLFQPIMMNRQYSVRIKTKCCYK